MLGFIRRMVGQVCVCFPSKRMFLSPSTHVQRSDVSRYGFVEVKHEQKEAVVLFASTKDVERVTDSIDRGVCMPKLIVHNSVQLLNLSYILW